MILKVKMPVILLIFSGLITGCGGGNGNGEVTEGDNNNDEITAQAAQNDLRDDDGLVPQQERPSIELDREGDMDLEPEGDIITLAPEEYNEKRKSGNVQIVDLRQSGSYRSTHIPGAEHKDFTDIGFFRQIDALDKSKPVMIYCQDGGLSTQAASLISVEGFPEVVILEGGFDNWQRNNMPVE